MSVTDPVLDRLNQELPGMFPRFGARWEQYLMSWQPVLEDGKTGLRTRLQAVRRELRTELGLSGRREKPGWDRRIVLEHFWFLYEKSYLKGDGSGFLVEKFLKDARADFGDIEAVCLWHSYPRLGLDERNQFDYYRDLPGGMPELTRVVRHLQLAGVRVFLIYNPWDVGTRRERLSDKDSLAWLLQTTGADGIFLDTVDSADRDLLKALRRGRLDIAVTPELVPPLGDLAKVSGCWQQFAVPSPPLALAHRWLDPGFCPRLVDRSARSHAGQVAAAFLHGTGHVVWENVFGWWNPWSDSDRLLLKKTSTILRAFDEFFRDPEWEPYVPTGVPGVHAMEWHAGNAALFTMLNTNESRCDGIRIKIPEQSGSGLVDIWSSRELPRTGHGHSFVISLDAGEIGCVVAGLDVRPLVLPSDVGDPQRHRPVTLSAYRVRPAPAPSTSQPTNRDMVTIPGGRYVMRVRRACDPVMEGGTYSDISHPAAKDVPDQFFRLEGYQMDRTPVTKALFQSFLSSTRYLPGSLHNFLLDWVRPRGRENEPWEWTPRDDRRDHPATWVSLDDARAYARWAGLRLPTEAQWQRAAEGPRGRLWPWGDSFDAARCNGDSAETTAVDAFPAGQSEEGCLDLCGNVWEWTESERDDGHMRYVMVRGGCHRRITGSAWYTASGAQPCDVHEKVPLMAAGIDRLSTVGFRCVRSPGAIPSGPTESWSG